MTNVRLTQRGKNVRNIIIAAIATALLLLINAQMVPQDCRDALGITKDTPECAKYITWGS